MQHVKTQSKIRTKLYHGVVAAQSRFGRRQVRRPGIYFDYFPHQTAADERANGWTHGIAAVISAVAGVWLIAAAIERGDPFMTLACVGYSFSLTAVMSMSALSHIVCQPRLRHLFRTLDQAAIYLLTATSCSPFFMRFLTPNGWGWMIPFIWAAALIAIWNKLRGDRVNSVSVGMAVAISWIPAIAAHPLLTYMPTGCSALVIITGGLYMLGVVFLCLDHRRQYFHAIWHVLVICASACTYTAILCFVI